MIGTSCPRCGARVPLSLAAPDTLRCVSCRHVGPLPGDVADRMRLAVDVFHAADLRGRQLTAAQRRGLTSSGLYTFLFLATFGVLAVPFLTCAVCALPDAQTGRAADPMTVVAFVGPLVVFAASGLFLFTAIGRARRKLQLACAANPPAAAGEPATCHVCGAPLPVVAHGAIVACDFCRADNVVSAEVLRRVHDVRHIVLDDFAADVRSQTIAVGSTAGRVTALAFGAALAAPVVVLVLCASIVVVAGGVEAPPDLTMEYVVAPTSAGTCVAEVERRLDGTVAYDFGSAPGMPSGPQAQPRGTVPAILRATELVGRVVRRPDGRASRVTRVTYSGIIVDHQLHLEPVATGPHAPTYVYARGACFADIP